VCLRYIITEFSAGRNRTATAGFTKTHNPRTAEKLFGEETLNVNSLVGIEAHDCIVRCEIHF